MTKIDDRPTSVATLSSGLATEVAPSTGSPSSSLSRPTAEDGGTSVFAVSHLGAGPLVSAVSLSSQSPFSEGVVPFVEETNPLFGSRYQVQSLLGSGGMGSVYLARDLALDELVALKILRKDIVRTPGALDMFRREVKLARKVTHPNVARTFDIGEADGQKYLTMECMWRVAPWLGSSSGTRSPSPVSSLLPTRSARV